MHLYKDAGAVKVLLDTCHGHIPSVFAAELKVLLYSQIAHHDMCISHA